MAIITESIYCTSSVDFFEASETSAFSDDTDAVDCIQNSNIYNILILVYSTSK